MPEPREVGVAVAIILFALALALVLVTRRRPVVRLLAISAAILTGLRLYSATSFLWAGDIDREVLGVLRFLVLSVTTAALILIGAVLAYFIRSRDDT